MRTYFFVSFLLIFVLPSCSVPNVESYVDEYPPIYPDYNGVTIPSNITPLNFMYLVEEKAYLSINGNVLIASDRKGNFCFSKREWRKLINEKSDIEISLIAKQNGKWASYNPIHIHVAEEIDPYISYRLIPPGYQGWRRMGIYQRCLENYSEYVIHHNDNSGGNCVNCHTYNARNPEQMLMHARADFGGTYIFSGEKSYRVNIPKESGISTLVYPYWHPDGRHIAFSVNNTKQSFFAHNPNRIEVFDSASDVVILDTETGDITWNALTRDENMCETFPCFSPDGKYLYFCSSERQEQMPRDYDKAKYNLYRVQYDAVNNTLGDSLELVFDAKSLGKSASFPRVSPDGRFLVFTLHAYGNFSIWHKDADLYIMDLETSNVQPLSEFNSDDVESYHSWSSNGRWMVFSSRRDDGLYTRPYIGYIDSLGTAHKPFLMPQKYPQRYYQSQMNSYNLPEFTQDRVKVSKRRIVSTMRK